MLIAGVAALVAGAADAAYVRQHYTKYEYRIAMRDGVRLFTAVFVPKDASPDHPYPVLIERTPFSAGRHRASPRGPISCRSTGSSPARGRRGAGRSGST